MVHVASYGMSGTENLPAFADTVEQINLEGTDTAIRASIRHGIKAFGEQRPVFCNLRCLPLHAPPTVFTSTVNVVFNGDRPILNGRESDLPYLPLAAHRDHYSRTKMLAERLVLASSGRLLPDGKSLFRACALRFVEL